LAKRETMRAAIATGRIETNSNGSTMERLK